jgi:eukaryotic-like serine/threonine-protein kinase
MNRWIPTAAAILVAAVFAVPAMRHWREQPPPPPPPPQPLRAAWTGPDGLDIGAGGDYLFGLSLAPDGRQLAFPAVKAGVASLWLHDLRTGESQLVPGTDGGTLPFWSPDGSRIGFFAAGHLRVLDVGSGQIADIADAASPRGGAWSVSGDLVFSASSAAGLMKRNAGGSITTFTTLDSGNGETSHAWPSFLSDGKHVVFFVNASQPSRAGIWIASLDDPSQRRRLVASNGQAIVVGHTLLYLRDLVLVAQPIDPVTFEPTGRSSAVAVNAGRGPLGQVFATASNDVLIYGAPGTLLRELRWVSRDGQPAGPVSEPLDVWDLRIAPDGRRIATTEVDRQFRTLDVFIRNGSQPAPLRLSLSTDVDESGVWSPDGLRIAWAGQRRKVMLRGAGAVLPEQTIAEFDTPVQVWDWSHDGRFLLIGRKSNDHGDDLWIQPPTEGRAAQPYVTAPFDQTYGAFSPDGRAIAYASNESGQFDIYLDAFPKPGARVRLTTAGGTEPRWSSDGRELFFRRGSELHAVVLTGLEVRSVARLFDAGSTIRAYDVSGDRFLINVPAAGQSAAPITLINHWLPQTGHGTTETRKDN